MSLTDTKVRQIKPQSKDYKLADEKGLFLLVKSTGAKYWRLKYRFASKEKLLALGVYPAVSLKQAREARDRARQQLANGVDPSTIKQATKQARASASANSFAAIAWEWFAKQSSQWTTGTATKRKALLENDFIPWLGDRPIADITAMDILTTLQRIESRGALETAHRGRQVAAQIFRYARLTQRTDRDPVQDLKGALAPKTPQHRPAITNPKEFGTLLHRIDRYRGSIIVRSLLALCPLLFQRPGEMIAMEWQELDLEAGEWSIPAEKMKMAAAHLVPLSRQAVGILKDLYPLTGNGRYVFPSQRRGGQHASNGTINKALKGMGYDTSTTMCAHGFRASARTMLDEVLGFRIEWIEHQLAHTVRDALGRAYNRTTHLPQRKEMMQRWADYLDQLAAQTEAGNVVAGNFRKAGA